MTNVLDTSTGQVVDHPDAQIAADWQAGKVQPIEGQTYHFQFQNGSYSRASTPQEIAAAVQQGGQFVSAAAAQSAVNAEHYENVTGGALGAGAAEALSQGTLGLSDLAGAGLFGDKFRRAREYQESAHPIASMIGGGIGAGALTAATGVGALGEDLGGQLLGRGAAEATEEGLGEAAEGGLSGLARRAGAKAIGGAVAGAQMGVAQSVSQAAFQNPNLTAQQIISNVGMNALWGGLLGGAMGLIPGGHEINKAGNFDATDLIGPTEDASSKIYPASENIGNAGEGYGFHSDVPLDKIIGNTEPWSPEKLAALKETMATGNPIDPIRLARMDDGQLSVIDGIHRVQTAKDLGYTHIPAYVEDLPDGLVNKIDPNVWTGEHGNSTSVGEKIAGATPTDDAVGQVADRILGGNDDTPIAAEGLGAKLAKQYANLSGAISGHDPQDILEVLNNRSDLLNADKIRDQAARDIRSNVDNLITSNRDLQEIWERGVKRSYIKENVAWVDPEVAKAASFDAIDSTYRAVQNMVDNPDQFGGVAAVNRAMQITKDISGKLDKAWRQDDVAEMYGLVDDLKKGIGKYAKGANRAIGNPTDELLDQQVKARATVYRNLYEDLRTNLENSQSWGAMGDKQKAINLAFTNQIDAAGRFNRALTTTVGRDPTNPFRDAVGVDPAKASTYVNNLLNPNNDLTHQAVNDYIQNTKSLATAMNDAFDLQPKQAKAVRQIQDASQAFQDTLDRQTKNLKLVNQYAELRNQTEGHSMALGAALTGAYLGHPLLGAAVSRLADVFGHPAETIRKLAVIEKMANDSDGFIGKTLRNFGVGRGVSSTPKINMADYSRRAAQVEGMAANPNGLANNVKAATAPIASHAPAVAQALQSTAIRGAQFLASKLPPKLPIDPLDPAAKQPLPPADQRQSFLRYYQGVANPQSVLDSLRNNQLNLEGVEALQAVHPDYYANLQKAAMNAMASRKLDGLSVNQRYGLGILLNLPAPELSPDYVAARQTATMARFGAFDPAALGSAPPNNPGVPANPSHKSAGRRSKSLPNPTNPKTGSPMLIAERLESST